MEKFALVVAYPTLQAAAHGLGVTRQALANQIRTLERHMGVRLLHRATAGLPMRPTSCAIAIIDAIHTVDHRISRPSGERSTRMTQDSRSHGPKVS
ncbi:helix-turn-helix domain-containing protein [Mycobacterium avium]|uniref:helix-turn-helix domain-containing protein n=1 Tax=Mycobacterium avium TaxID=1764 RepID=UPI00373FD874